jgi:hypothetical protein
MSLAAATENDPGRCPLFRAGGLSQHAGETRLALRVAKGAPKARMVSEVIADLPRSAWKRLAMVEAKNLCLSSCSSVIGFDSSKPSGKNFDLICCSLTMISAEQTNQQKSV